MNSAIEADNPIKYYSHFLGVDHVIFEVRQDRSSASRNPTEQAR